MHFPLQQRRGNNGQNRTWILKSPPCPPHLPTHGSGTPIPGYLNTTYNLHTPHAHTEPTQSTPASTGTAQHPWMLTSMTRLEMAFRCLGSSLLTKVGGPEYKQQECRRKKDVTRDVAQLAESEHTKCDLHWNLR